MSVFISKLPSDNGVSRLALMLFGDQIETADLRGPADPEIKALSQKWARQAAWGFQEMEAAVRDAIELPVGAMPKAPVTGGKAQDTDPEVIVEAMSEIEAREMTWLWPGRIPAGRITLMVGRPGEGKSFLSTYMAANVSRGRTWIDGEPCEQGKVILISGEDDPHDTIRPRLDAHEADVNHVHLVRTTRRYDENGNPRDLLFSLTDVEHLDRAIGKIGGVKLIVVDPIGTFLGPRADAHRDNEVRSVLQPVATLAEKHGCAVLVVAHRRKTVASHADDVVLGSRAFTGLARAVWHVSRDPEDTARRLFLAGICNVAPENTGLAFRIEGAPPVVLFESDPVVMSADDALQAEQRSGKRGPEPEALQEACDWLREILADGPVVVNEIREMAQNESISNATLRRAKSEVGAVAMKVGYMNQTRWQWRLPEGAQDAQVAHRRDENLSTFDATAQKTEGAQVSTSPEANVSTFDDAPALAEIPEAERRILGHYWEVGHG